MSDEFADTFAAFLDADADLERYTQRLNELSNRRSVKPPDMRDAEKAVERAAGQRHALLMRLAATPPSTVEGAAMQAAVLAQILEQVTAGMWKQNVGIALAKSLADGLTQLADMESERPTANREESR